MLEYPKLLLITSVMLFWSLQVQAQDVPQFIHYQDNLANTNGNPVNDNLQMIFLIVAEETGGPALWTEIHNGVLVEEGLFNVQLGEFTPFPSALFSDERYLEINIAGEELTPRQKIGSMPFALTTESSNAINMIFNGQPMKSRVEIGIIGNCILQNNAGSSGNVTFSKPFSNPPIVFLQVDESGSNSGAVTVRIIARSVTGFAWNSWVGGTLAASDCIHWIAIGN